MGMGYVACHGEHEREGMLSCRNGIAGWRVHHHHAVLGSSIDLDVVDTDSRTANELAGQANQGPLALEAGLNLGEVMLIAGQHSKAADVLARVTQIAQALRNPSRERAATSLLAQARASLKQYEGAIAAGQRTLQLTQSLKFTRLEAIDLYNLGLFHLMKGSPTEAVSLFRQSRPKADATNVGFLKELLFNMGGALTQIGENSAAVEAFRAALPAATQAKDWK